MQYEVVFDAAEAGYRQWWFPAMGVVFGGVIAILSVVVGRFRPGPAHPSRRWGGVLFWVIFIGLWCTLTFLGTWRDYANLRDALQEGRYTVVEGTVVEFAANERRDSESFCVGDHRYEYSRFKVMAGFNQPQSRGGPIREGLKVRIADVGGQIARLEVATAQAPPERIPEPPWRVVLFWLILVPSVLGFVWMFAKYWQVRSRRPKLGASDIVYEEWNASGRSLKNAMTKSWFAFGFVRLVITHDTLWITLPFPFSLFMAASEIEQTIPRSQIASIEESTLLGKRCVEISFEDAQGTRHAVQLFSRNTDEFIKALGEAAPQSNS